MHTGVVEGDAGSSERAAARGRATHAQDRRHAGQGACASLSLEADAGEFATAAELAEREGIASSYMTRVLRLTLLTPDIIEAILDGRQGPEVTLARVMEPFQEEWQPQVTNLRVSA